MQIKKSGFTLIELLVVMAILGILSTIGFSQYRTSQKKAHDAQRKVDLSNIARALEMYYNDNQSYPHSEGGKILIGTTPLVWGEDSLSITKGEKEIVYMEKLPRDPASNFSYCYQSDGNEFKIYAKLENEKDPAYGTYSCNDKSYQYGIASSNATP